MSFITDFFRRKKTPTQRPFVAPLGQMRGFMAASTDRLMNDLNLLETPYLSGNSEIRHVLTRLRSRSRALANNSEYFQNAIGLMQKGIIGANGMTLQMQIYKSRNLEDLDVKANQTIEEAWKRFSDRRNFSANRKQSRASFERSLIRGLVTDGEVIIEKLYGKRYPFGIAFRQIDPDLLDENLVVNKHGVVGNSPDRKGANNRIIMGVEIDDVDEPVAYWFKERYVGTGDAMPTSEEFQGVRRIPADRIIHAYMDERQRVGMTRGVPWLVSGIRRIAMLNGFEEAALVNARFGASKMLFYKQPALSESEEAAGFMYEDEETKEAREQAAENDAYIKSNLRTQMEAGTLGVLPAGWSIEQFNPNYPNNETDPFVKAQVRAFASAAGINYTSLSGDLAAVSLSSLRQGANNDRDTYEAIQEWFVDHIERELFESWLETGLDFGYIGNLPSSGFERFNRPLFLARHFRSPDPQKDVAADAQAVSLGIKSRHQICAERGVDFEEILDQLAREKRLMEDAGVTQTNVNPESHKNPPVTEQDGEPNE